MPTIYNKVTANGQTLIDLSQDTVTSAADIKVGQVGHVANGAQVTGTVTFDADAVAADLNNGKTAYVNGVKITGSQIINKFYTGSSTPSSLLGNNGDIYLQE